MQARGCAHVWQFAQTLVFARCVECGEQRRLTHARERSAYRPTAGDGAAAGNVREADTPYTRDSGGAA